jgi:hypothetical protein
MDEQQQRQNIELRLRRLEQLHIWASALVVVGVAYYFITKK